MSRYKCLQVGDKDEMEVVVEVEEIETASLLSVITIPTLASLSFLYPGLSIRTLGELAGWVSRVSVFCSPVITTHHQTNSSIRNLLRVVLVNFCGLSYIFYYK